MKMKTTLVLSGLMLAAGCGDSDTEKLDDFFAATDTVTTEVCRCLDER